MVGYKGVRKAIIAEFRVRGTNYGDGAQRLMSCVYSIPMSFAGV